MMEIGQKAGNTSHGDKKEGIKTRTSSHAKQHCQFGINILESRTMEEGQKARSASHRDEKEDVKARVFIYTKQHD